MSKNETKEEKDRRIFNYYKTLLGKEGWTRFITIEYLCQFPKIEPYIMAAKLMEDGVTIYFDDSTISPKKNAAKEREVKKLVNIWRKVLLKV